MSRIHITLVGGQPAPIYNAIVATEPEKVIFICSDDTKDICHSIQREIHIPSELKVLDPIDPIKILRCAKEFSDKYSEDKVCLNISSGLKSWSHLFGLTFDKCDNAEIVYMDQNNVLWNYSDMTYRSDFIFDMHTQFRLYGNDLKNNYIAYNSFTEEDKDVCKKIENIRGFNHGAFNQLTINLPQNQIPKQGEYVDAQSKSYIRWVRHENMSEVEINLFKNNGLSTSVFLKSAHAIELVFHSGWFEYKIASMLAKWDKVQEICLNCRFPNAKNQDKNEVDIIVNTGTKIFFVECKTQINKPTDIDKFRSVVKTYGGMGSKALFVTDAIMSDLAKTKCEEHSVLTFSLKDSSLGLPSEKALIYLLETALFNINTK